METFVGMAASLATVIPRFCVFGFVALSVLPVIGQVADNVASQAGHSRMIATLAKLDEQAQRTNPYFGDSELERLKEFLADRGKAAPPNIRMDALVRVGSYELRLGREADAVKHWTEAAKLISKGGRNVPPQIRETATLQLAIAYLRVGETQNCCVRNNPESCIFPVQGKGVHTRPQASRAAIRMLELLLANSRNRATIDEARWLLNIAYMTVGDYPDKVPREHLLDASRLEQRKNNKPDDTAQPFPRFTNVAQSLGLGTFSASGGAVADDFDGDGRLDLIVSTYEPRGQIQFFHSQPDGSFVNRTETANLKGITGGLNLVQADYNNDGHLDVLVLRGGWWKKEGRHPNSLLRNNGDNTFSDVTYAAGLAEPAWPTQTASWGDYDLDGDVDLYIGNEHSPGVEAPNQLFRNNGDGTFTDVAENAGVADASFTKSVIFGDFNKDRWPDIYVSNFGEPNRLYQNDQDGTFSEVADRMGVAAPKASFPSWFWDVDNDGRQELFVSAYSAQISDLAAWLAGEGFSADLPRLYRFEEGKFVDRGRDFGLAQPSAPMGSNFGDLNNDGYLDFYLGTGWPEYKSLMPNLMYLNRGGTRFENVTIRGGFGHLQKGHAITFADLDQDGDQDVFQQMGGAFPGDRFFDALYQNPGFDNHWLAIRLVGRKSNRAAIGARIKVTLNTDPPRQVYRWVNSGGTFGCNPLTQQIGLGKSEGEHRIEVFWPVTGETQVVSRVLSNQRIQIEEGAKSFKRLD